MSIRNRLGIRSGAVILAVGGLGLGLIGSGVHAAFTDGGTATESISVGSLSIALSSTTTGAVVSTDKHSITYTPAAFASSAASTAPLQFTVTNNGSIPAVVTVTKVDTFTSGTFSDLLTPVPAPVTVLVAGTFDYNGGIGWTALQSTDQGKTESVVYTITASA